MYLYGLEAFFSLIFKDRHADARGTRSFQRVFAGTVFSQSRPKLDFHQRVAQPYIGACRQLLDDSPGGCAMRPTRDIRLV